MTYSVLMSLYNEETVDNLRQSIDSILAQTVRPNEIVIIKDGPLGQELDDVLTRYSEEHPQTFHYIEFEKNMGLGTALNRGVLECRNEWIARMDTDDIAVTTRMEKQIGYLEAHPDIDMLGSVYYEFFGDTDHCVLRDSPETHDELIRYMHKRNPFGHDTMFLRKNMILTAGNYHPNIRFEDYDLWIRMVLCGAKLHNLKEPLLYVRGSSSYYSRRGGWKYMKLNIGFFKKYYKSGFFTIGDCVLSLIPRCLVCLLPNAFRTFVYKRMLRSKKTEV